MIHLSLKIIFLNLEIMLELNFLIQVIHLNQHQFVNQ